MHIWQTGRGRRALVWVALPLVAYTVIALIMTWPLASRLQSHIAGVSYGDSYMMLRQAWGAREALLAGRNPFEQTLFAYPEGFTSYMMWSTPLRWVPVMLLSFVVPPVVAFNVWLIATLILNGTTAYWLGMELADQNPAAALLGGLVFMAFPNMQGHLAVGHIDVLAMYGLPLFALCAWRVLRSEAGWRAVGWGGLWLAVACLGLTSQIVYNLLPVAGFLGLYHLLWDRGRLFRRDLPLSDQPWLKFGAMIGLGGVILLIFFGPLMTDAGQAEMNRISEPGRVTFSADLLAFVSPSIFGPMDDLGLVPEYARDVLGTNSTEGSAYLGVVPFLLVIVGLARCRSARPWLLVGLGAAVFSLGPLLKWRDDPVVFRVDAFESYVTLPWAALQDLPVLDATRTPGRFNGATALAWAALVSVGAGVLIHHRDTERTEEIKVKAGEKPQTPGILDAARQFFIAVGLALPRAPQAVPLQNQTDSAPDSRSPFTGRGFRGGVVILLGALILVEYTLFWPFPTLDARQPDYFRQLAGADDVRAVLNVPVDNPLVAMEAMYQQTIHGKPMIAGQLYRRTPQDPAVLAVLDRAVTDGDDFLPAMSDEDVPYLLSITGADRVIVHKYFSPDDNVLTRLAPILGSPEYEDDQIAAFVVPSVTTPSDYMLEYPAFGYGGGWQFDSGRNEFVPKLFMSESLVWYFFTPGEFYGVLEFLFEPFVMPRQMQIRLDDHLISAIQAGYQWPMVRQSIWVEPGFHTLRIDVPDGCTDYAYSVSCLAGGECKPLNETKCISFELGLTRWLTPGSINESVDGRIGTDVVPVDYRFDQGMRLRGYDVFRSGPVRLKLFWSADHALPGNYALFVHVADPETGEPVTQYDGYPVIPTDEWEDDTRWVSDVTIPWPDDLPPGEYAINVGWFDPDTGERLTVLAEPSADQPWADEGMIHLGTIEVQ